MKNSELYFLELLQFFDSLFLSESNIEWPRFFLCFIHKYMKIEMPEIKYIHYCEKNFNFLIKQMNGVVTKVIYD